MYKRQMKLNRVEQGVLYSCRKVGKRMMKYKKVFVIFISIMFSLGLAGCSRQEDAERTEYTEEVKIPMLLTIDPSTGNKNEEDVITAFNEEYKGRYQIDVELSLIHI